MLISKIQKDVRDSNKPVATMTATITAIQLILRTGGKKPGQLSSRKHTRGICHNQLQREMLWRKLAAASCTT
eukprot:9753191-Ditylum_brightwellii.AAC.1